MPRIPFTVTAEYRGQSPAGSATIDGDTVDYAAGLKFEIPLADGDVDIWSIRQNKLDQAGDFDSAKLQKGDMVSLTGTAVVGQKQGERSFMQVLAATRLAKNGQPVHA
jgi:hypothetical protein